MSRVLIESHGRVTHLINNAPEQRNAFGLDFYDAMIPAIEAAGADEGVGAVVISGAGASLAAMCDLIVAEPSSYFMLAYVKIGITPDGGATWSFARALPRQFASEMALTGGKVPAERLHQLGVVNRLSETTLADALAWGAELAEGPSASMAAIKKLVRDAEEDSLEAQFEAEAVGIATALASKDGIEGATAFLEKRKAKFHG